MPSYKQNIKTIEQIKARVERFNSVEQYEFIQFEDGVQLLTDSQYGKITITSRITKSYGGKDGFFEVRLINSDGKNGLEKLLNKKGCCVVGWLTLSEALEVAKVIKFYPMDSLKRLVEALDS